MKLCKCGCGQPVRLETHKFINGHNSRVDNPMNYAKYRKKVSDRLKGHFVSEETKKKISDNHADVSGKNNPMYGKTHSKEARKRISKAQTAENNNVWKGGIDCKGYIYTFGKDRHLVKERDNYLCQDKECKRKSKRLEVHHIDHDKLNGDYINLITLCRQCHSLYHNKLNKKIKSTEYTKTIMEKYYEN